MKRRRDDRRLELDALREQHDIALARRGDRVLEPRNVTGALDQAPPPRREDCFEREPTACVLSARPG